MQLKTQNNLIDINRHVENFKDKNISFSVSSRYIRPDIDIIDYLKILYIYCDIRQIDSVFGNTSTFSRFYGGRQFNTKYALTQDHLARMADHGIGLALTLTNHFFDESDYKESRALLKKHHKQGNSIICTNDELAARIKHDYPDYELKASIIKNINTVEKINDALKIYDSLTLPMDKNDDDFFLEGIQEKKRIILFGNAGCAYTCPARTCYLGFSQKMTGRPVTSGCSKSKMPRLDMGSIYFNVKKLSDMGFKRFKLIPVDKHWSEPVARNFSNKKSYFLKSMKLKKGLFYICSYPKCGRTWLRFILANYLNLKFDLKLDVDLHSLFSMFPNDTECLAKGPGVYGFADDRRFPLVLSSHLNYSEKSFGEAGIVFLLRSVLDVVVSNYFHVSKFMGVYKGDLDTFIRDTEEGVDRYCRYINTWVPFLNHFQTKIITYEMLHQNTEKVTEDLLNFLNMTPDSNYIREAINLSSFENMEQLEKKRGVPGSVGNYDDPDARRLRKGRIGGYKTHLDQEALVYINERCCALLSPESKALLKNHGLVPEQIAHTDMETLLLNGSM